MSSKRFTMFFRLFFHIWSLSVHRRRASSCRVNFFMLSHTTPRCLTRGGLITVHHRFSPPLSIKVVSCLSSAVSMGLSIYLSIIIIIISSSLFSLINTVYANPHSLCALFPNKNTRRSVYTPECQLRFVSTHFMQLVQVALLLWFLPCSHICNPLSFFPSKSGN